MKIIMLCTGNICRSPMAEGLMRYLCLKNNLDIEIDSAGVENYHKGQNPDYRAVREMHAHGIDISNLKARQLKIEDVLDESNLIMAAENSHMYYAKKLKEKSNGKANIVLMLKNKNLADPYYGTDKDFEFVYNELFDSFNEFISEFKKVCL